MSVWWSGLIYLFFSFPFFLSLSLLIFAVMAAELVKHFFPKLVEMHNYVPANSTQQKHSNWSVLNRQDHQAAAAPLCLFTLGMDVMKARKL